MVPKLRKEKEKDEKRKEAIEKAEVAEVEMLLVGLRALDPVHKEDIGDADVHNSHLFTVEKFTADGVHDKFKSRMVMNGDEQDPDMYPDRSSPTVAINSLLMCLAVAEQHYIRKSTDGRAQRFLRSNPFFWYSFYGTISKNKKRTRRRTSNL
jgi:hypothetical protein